MMAGAGLVALVGTAAAANAPHRPCLIELFTSQGCSSCPPADKIVADLKRTNEADIVLSFATDTWDFSGWKDTLASPLFTARQKGYAAVRRDGRIYTPQVVVDGVTDTVGSDKVELDEAIRDVERRAEAMSVEVHLIEDGHTIRIQVPAGPQAPADVLLFRVQPAETVAIARGGNAGRQITYTNVVRGMTKLATWTGAAQTIDVPALHGDGEGYVVILQKGSLERPGPVLAAAKTAGL